MKNVVLSLLLFGSSLSALAGEGKWSGVLDPVFSPVEKRGMVAAAEVISLRDGSKLYSLHSSQPVTPASGIKLITAWTALERLGAGYTFETQALRLGSISGDTLRGDLLLLGGGDPSLVIERLFLLAREVSRKGIKKITGSIVVDARIFDSEKQGDERIDSDSDRAYNAPISGLSLNYNSITLKISAGRLSSPPHVTVDPDMGYLKVRNLAKTGRAGSPYNLSVSRAEGDRGDQVTLKGNFPVNLGEQTRYLAISQPDLYAGEVFCTLLREAGVKVSCSQVRRVRATDSVVDAPKVAKLESFPLREIITLMDKFSNNFIAESLVKALGHESTQKPGSASSGLAVLREQLKGIGITQDTYTLVSGSGLTDQNRVTVHQLNQVLLSSYQGLKSFPELVSSFPLAGVDGTLKNRFKDSTVTGLLRAKTGTIDGVVALMGVVPNENGEFLGFSVVINDPKGRTDRSWEEAFARILRGQKN